MLRRWPAILAALAAGALLLGATAAAPALFLASTGTDALERAVAESTRYGAGVTIAFRELRRGVLPGADDPVPTAPVRDEVLEAAAGLPYLDDDRILSMLGDPVEVTTQRPGAGPANPVRVVHRTGALDHIRVLEGSPTGQIRPFARPTRGQTPTHPAWIQDVTAEALEVGPGDLVTLGSGETKAVVEVAGIYEALANAPPRAYWEPLAEEFRPPSVDAPLPPPFVLVERAAFDDVTDELRQREAEFQWEFPLEVDATLDVTSATDLVADFTRLNGRLLDVRSPLGRYFEARCRSCPGRLPIRMDFRSTLEQDVVEARDTVAGLRPSIELLAVVGLVSAIVVVGAAGAYSVNRRRTEVRYLIARGMAPATVGWKSAVESFLPATAGTAAGFALVAIALARFGPGATLDPAGVAEAARVTAVVLPVALVVIGVVAAAASIPPSERRSFARLTWEIPVLALAAFALREIVRRGGVVTESASGVERPSAWLLVFPVLLVAGVAGLAARGFRRTLVMMRRRDRGASMPVYLAMNRLAAARALALMLITASALAFGMFLYAQTMAASVEATTVAKSHVFTGSDVSVPVDRSYVVPESFPWPSTLTSTKLDAGRVQPGNTTVDVLAIDVETFEDAAYWDDSFSDRPLGALVDELRDPPPSVLPVIVAGELPDGAVLEMGGVEIPHDVVARVDAWPGRFLDRTLVVINRATSGPVIEQAGGLDPVTAAGAIASLWIKGDTGGITASLADLGFGPDDSFSAESVLRNPAFVAVSRTFRFLEALGSLAALLVLVGTVLYIQSRQRPRALSYALARRMGLRRKAHFAALVIELGCMLALALATGLVLGGVAARLVYPYVDLLPNVPPEPLLRVPFAATVPATVIVVLATSVGAARAHRTAERADVAEVLRADG